MKYFEIDQWVTFRSLKNHPWSGMQFKVSEIHNKDGIFSYTLKYGNRLVLADADEVEAMFNA